MSKLSIIKEIEAQAAIYPDSIAIEGDKLMLSYEDLIDLIEQCSKYINESTHNGFAIDLDNCPEWAILDLALLNTNKVGIPIPRFFVDSQIQYLLADGGVQTVFTDTPDKFDGVVDKSFNLCGRKVYQVSLDNNPIEYPVGTVKVTYTSGTTGEPKGVCIDALAITKTIHSVIQRSKVNRTDRHFSALPMTTLLENIAGLYVTLTCGATAIIFPQEDIGICGATGINPQKFIQLMDGFHPTTTILIPQMLQAMVGMVEMNSKYLTSMKFIAVGGAPISSQILNRAEVAGLPVYEGYGLSESTSVVTVNGPGASKTGTVGKVLEHIDLKIAGDGEIFVRGSIFKGYLKGGLNHLDRDGYLPTGDLGVIDEDGFLTIKGRKKNLFITSFGRNVAPEWVESELVAQLGIIQAAVFGDGKPWNVAVIMASAGADIDKAIQQANKSLPDYAQVSAWILADEPFLLSNNQLTGTGRLKREVIEAYYQQSIENIYKLDKEIA
jgi:long-subunit acyl-CoA synthetase (AMP-forming)